MENVWDIIQSAEPNKYSLAKQRLLSTFKESENRQIKRLISEVELGDMKPSQLLRKMRSLAGDGIAEKVLRSLWLDKLPDSVKSIILISEENLDKVALMADKIVEMTPSANVCSIKTSPTGATAGNPSSDMSELLSRMAALEAQISSISRSRSRSRSSSRSSTSSRGKRPTYNPKGKYCFYHFRFRNRCRPEKCQPPCSWKPSENSSQQ